MSREIVLHNDGTATVMMKLKWFHFSQNNSGGRFVVDDNQAEDVFVQASSAKEAIDYIWDKLDHSFCPCCGERWYNYIDDSDGMDHPEVYGVSIYNTEKPSFRNECRLHFYDGHIEAYNYGEPVIERISEQV